jgi:hypothetical protein
VVGGGFEWIEVMGVVQLVDGWLEREMSTVGVCLWKELRVFEAYW